MQNKSNYKGSPKKSKTTLSPGLLQALKKIYLMNGGTITYVFTEERIDFTNPKYPNGENIENKTHLTSPINSCILYNENGSKKSPQDIVLLFEDTKNDLGASYFIIN